MGAQAAGLKTQVNPSKLLLAPLALLIAAAAPPAQDAGAGSAAERVRADVEFLASDLLEGRDTGSRGYAIAAAYVASEFRAIGLQPGGTDSSWYQQVPFRTASHAAPPQASLQLGRSTIALGPADFAVRPSLSKQVRTIDSPLVFVGHGISDPRLGIDDYRGIDARGKIVLVLDGAPDSLDSEIYAHLDSSKQQTAVAKGAIGLIEIAGSGKRPGSRDVAAFGRPLVDWVGETGRIMNASTLLDVNGGISKTVAERLIAAAGREPGKVLSGAGNRKSDGSFDLPARLRLSDTAAWADFTSPNVIGRLPGSDPALAGEHVVLMGHLDHLGLKADAKPGEDAIYNGALDNAAGIATMLEAARTFARSGERPRRSILFVAVTGEEKGLRGADYLAANPTVPQDSIVGVVNLDMPMLLYPFTDVIAFGGDHSTVARTIADAALAMGVSVSADPMPQEAIFVRSDHYPFVRRGIPSILLMTGYANGGEAKWKDFFDKIYHKPNDDLSQPILWDEGARYAELNYRIARALADADRRPQWYEGDYFGDAFAPEQERATKLTP